MRTSALTTAACAILVVVALSRGDVEAQAGLTDAIAPAAAKAGEHVAITGRGFGSHNVRVEVGNLVANVVAASGHRVVFVVPAGVRPGVTQVTVRNPGGRAGSIGFRVVGTVPPQGQPPQLVSEETARAVSGTITEDGGSLAATALDGTTYSLLVPPGAVLSDTVMTITPATPANLPLSGNALAVRLQPSGLQLLRPAILAITPADADPDPGGPPADRTLGFLFDDDGSDFEVLRVVSGGASLAIEVTHFSGAGTAGASAADFAASLQPLLSALPSDLPPTQVTALVSTLVAWLSPSTPGGLPHFELCTTTNLCQQVFTIALQSLQFHRDQACAQAESLVQAGEPFPARQAVARVAGLSARLVELGNLAEQAGVSGFDQSFDVACIAVAIDAIVEVTREQVLENPRGGLLALMLDLAADAEALELEPQMERARLAIDLTVNALTDRAILHCLTAPDAGEFLIAMMRRVFPQNFLDSIDPGLGRRILGAFAECRIRIEPATATVGAGQTFEFTGSAEGLDPQTVTWSVSGGGTINALSGLFTAGELPGTFTVTATSVVPPDRPEDPQRRKTASITVVPVTVAVSPLSVTLQTGATQQFAVTVSGLPNVDVVWTATGGTIDPLTGSYTAGTTPGPFRVRATSVESSAFGEALVTIVAPTGRITAMNHVVFIGACASADMQVLTAGFANPAMTFSVLGDGAIRNQILIGTTTFTTWRAGNGASGEIAITARSVESPSVTATTSFRVDPFVAAYGGGSAGSAFIVRGVDAGLPDNTYRLSLVSNASVTGIYIVTASGNTLSGTGPNGNRITVDITTSMQGSVAHAGGTTAVSLSRNCAP